jgi:hypothetical protein
VIGSGTIVEWEWVRGALILQGANERELARLGHVQHPELQYTVVQYSIVYLYLLTLYDLLLLILGQPGKHTGVVGNSPARVTCRERAELIAIK